MRKQEREVGALARLLPGVLGERRGARYLSVQAGGHAHRLLVVVPRDADQRGVVGVGRQRFLVGAHLLEQVADLVGGEALVPRALERGHLLDARRRAARRHHRPLIPLQHRLGPVEVVDLLEAELQLDERC